MNYSKNINPLVGNGRVERLVNQFGDGVVLVPVSKGTKKPTVKNYTNFTAEKMSNASYCRKLAEGNIAILVGPNSGNLISIDFDDQAAYEEFSSLNPVLCNTLQSFGARGRNLWFRMTGEYVEKIVKLENGKGELVGEWRGGAGFTIVDGVHPDGVDYQIDTSYSIREISGEDLSWPDGWRKYPGKRDAFKILMDRLGPPYLEGANGGFQLNESFVAGWIASEVEMAYTREFQGFFQYSAKEGVWKPLVTPQVDAIISRYLSRLARESGKKELHFKKRKFVIGSIRSQLEAALFSSFLPTFSGKGWHLVAAANAVLGVVVPTATRESLICPFLPFAPGYRLLGKSEVSYEDGAQCPRFLNELLRPVLEADDVLLLQKMYGLILLGGDDQQKILLLEGAGGLGKGVITRVLDRVLGRSLVTELRTRHLNNRFENSRYLGKRLLAGRDVSSDFLKSEGASVLKALTGGDTLSTECKNANEFEDIKGDFHVVITSNSPLLLRIDDDSTAWERRLVIILFREPGCGLSKRISRFEEILLKEEGPGILNWILEGAKLALNDVFELGTIALTPTQRARVSDRVRVSDTVDYFVESGLVLASDHCISSQHLLEAYGRFCSDKALSREPERVFHIRVKNLIGNRFSGKVTYSENIQEAGVRSSLHFSPLVSRD